MNANDALARALTPFVHEEGGTVAEVVDRLAALGYEVVPIPEPIPLDDEIEPPPIAQAAEASDREAAERATDSVEPVRNAGSDRHPSAAVDLLDVEALLPEFLSAETALHEAMKRLHKAVDTLAYAAAKGGE